MGWGMGWQPGVTCLRREQKVSLQKQCEMEHEGGPASCIIHPAARAEMAGLSRVRSKMQLFFFNSIVAPSPHHLSSSSQQNTSKTRFHKRGTHQALRGLAQTPKRTGTHCLFFAPQCGTQIRTLPSNSEPSGFLLTWFMLLNLNERLWVI